MFSLHETTQRRVCRAAFVACAVMPMLATLAFVAYSLRPWREADWQRTLAQELHVRATVAHVAAPRPGITRLTSVQLADLRSGRQFASLDTIEVRRRGSQLVLSSPELGIEVAQLPSLAATIATWLATEDLPQIELQVDRLKLVGGSKQSVTLSDMRLQCESGAGQSRRLGIQSGTCRLLVECDGATSAMLDTGATSLPAWLLVDLFPSLSRCQDAVFVGTLRLEGDSQSMNGALRGRFDKIALKEWIGPGAQHQIVGDASVEIDELQWRGRRVELSQGRMRVDGGTASRSLLADLEKRLFCVVDPSVGNAENVRFDELACDFQLSGAGLTVAGRCRVADGPPGCVLAANGLPLLSEPRYKDLPVAQLVQVLSQPAASWLPASQEAHDMAGKLPLPGGPSTR